MKPRAFRPEGLDGLRLEPRALLSGTAGSAVVSIASTQLAFASKGTYKSSTLPDGMPMLTLRAPGNNRRRIIAYVGSLDGVAAMTTGRATGSAAIGPKSDFLRFSLLSEPLTSSTTGALPTRYRLTVTGGTGIYANTAGTGDATFTFRQVGKPSGLITRGKFTASYTIRLSGGAWGPA